MVRNLSNNFPNYYLIETLPRNADYTASPLFSYDIRHTIFSGPPALHVLLAYMTGILPIAKYSSGSELNMFSEFTLATEERFSEYFGFTEEEVDTLFARYQKKNEKSTIFAI